MYSNINLNPPNTTAIKVFIQKLWVIKHHLRGTWRVHNVDTAYLNRITTKYTKSRDKAMTPPQQNTSTVFWVGMGWCFSPIFEDVFLLIL